MYKISPSILAADFAKLGEEIEMLEKAGADYIHIDVMDGHFVPGITIGAPVIAALRKHSGLVFDVHLMVEEPYRYVKEFAEAGADIITVHPEACTHLDRTIEVIKGHGKKAGVSLNPATPLTVLDYVLPKLDMVLVMTVNPGFGGQKLIPYCLDKIKNLKQIMEEKGILADIEVDGGVTLDNTHEILRAGANILVAGTAVFSGNINHNLKAFKEVFLSASYRDESREIR